MDPQNGEYAYILLPGVTQEAVESFAPDAVTILANTQDVQCVREDTSGLTGYVFRKEGTFGSMTAHTPLIAMTHGGKDAFTLALSEPTQGKKAFSLSVAGVYEVACEDLCIQAERENLYLLR